jgi:hypothetical protein
MSNNIKETNFGYEAIWASTPDYCAKFVVFNKPEKTPIYYHRHTSKSWFINDGNFRIRWIDTTDGKLYQQDSGAGISFDVPCGMPVSLESLSSQGSITEVSNNSDSTDYHILIPSENIGE